MVSCCDKGMSSYAWRQNHPTPHLHHTTQHSAGDPIWRSSAPADTETSSTFRAMRDDNAYHSASAERRSSVIAKASNPSNNFCKVA